MSNDRRSRIPFEFPDQTIIKTDCDSVLGKWKTDYEQLYNNENSDTFDDESLHGVKDKLTHPDSPDFPKGNCSTLNCAITQEEVRKSFYETKLRKASGIDNIPAEVQTCI